MFIYIVINETNYPIGSFVEIEDARTCRNSKSNCKIIKSTLVGNLPNNNMGNAKKNLPDDLKNIFGFNN